MPTGQPILVHGPWSARYDLGPGHPLTPRRFGPGIDLVRAMHELAGGPPIRVEPPEPASDETLRWVHSSGYIEIVRRFSAQPFDDWAAGIGPGDTPAFAGMHEASAAVAGGSVRAMEAILAGSAGHAFHPGGGLHHAMADRAAGFCVYDDPALAIAAARRAGRRVLYVDLDVHHGDGVQAIHIADPGVLTLSIHQSGRTLFPGTGFVAELGTGAAAGTSINLPLDPGTGERGWLGALRAVLPEVAAAFRPDVVVSQHGADSHAWDPLANLRVTTTAMGAAARLVDAVAHRHAAGRWLATGGGGYDAYRVVPRMWSHVWLAAAHLEPPSATPAAWRERWASEAEQYGQAPLPEWLDDAENAGLPYDGAQAVADRRALETAGLVRDLAVPVLLRAATELRWWAPLDPSGAASGPSSRPPADPGSAVEILADVDAAGWDGLTLDDRVLPADPATAKAIVRAALAGPEGPRVTAAVASEHVVGAVVSTAPAGERLLLAIGVAPAFRRRGIATELLARHAGHGESGSAPASAPTSGPWAAAVTIAERDPIDPLPRDTRAAIARRLLERSGFAVERAGGPLGSADPAAVMACRA